MLDHATKLCNYRKCCLYYNQLSAKISFFSSCINAFIVPLLLYTNIWSLENMSMGSGSANRAANRVYPLIPPTVKFVNLSSITLTPAMHSLLQNYGLSFCPSPLDPDFQGIMASLGNFNRQIRRSTFFNHVLDQEDPSTNPLVSFRISQPDSDTDLDIQPFDYH